MSTVNQPDKPAITVPLPILYIPHNFARVQWLCTNSQKKKKKKIEMECSLSGFNYIRTNRFLSHCYQFIIVYCMHYALEGITPNNKQKHRTPYAQFHNYVTGTRRTRHTMIICWTHDWKRTSEAEANRHKKKHGVKFDLLFMVFYLIRMEENIRSSHQLSHSSSFTERTLETEGSF